MNKKIILRGLLYQKTFGQARGSRGIRNFIHMLRCKKQKQQCNLYKDACGEGNIELAKKRMPYHPTAWTWALAYNHRELIEILLKRPTMLSPASIVKYADLKLFSQVLNKCKNQFMLDRFLHFSILREKREFIDLLYSQDRKIIYLDMTLLAAIKKRYTQVAMNILNSGILKPKEDCLWYACITGQPAVVEKLLEYHPPTPRYVFYAAQNYKNELDKKHLAVIKILTDHPEFKITYHEYMYNFDNMLSSTSIIRPILEACLYNLQSNNFMMLSDHIQCSLEIEI